MSSGRKQDRRRRRPPAHEAQNQARAEQSSSGSPFVSSPSQGRSDEGASGPQPYVAIPRLQPENRPPAATERPRVQHACEACRQHKARCSGERPRCSRCLELDMECEYAAGKRARHVEAVGRLKEQHAQMLDILSGLRSRVASEDQQKIQDCLDMMSEMPQSGALKRTFSGGTKSFTGSEGDTTAEVGSPKSTDILGEDVETDEKARAIGYLGKGSDVQWLRTARERGFERGEERNGLSPARTANNFSSVSRGQQQKRSTQPLEPLSAATYHLDEQEMLTTQLIDPKELPTSGVAHTLFDYFMRNVNTDFPFVEDGASAHRMMSVIIDAQNRRQSRRESKYRAILNIIFAIGASYAHLIGNAQGDERDHFLYYTRARMLGLDGVALVEHPSYQVVQIAAMTGFYYLCCSQISRSWMITSHAIRAAFALGLHVRNQDREISGSRREERVRLWWALWLLERHLVALSGRPTAIYDRHCAVPRPDIVSTSRFQSISVKQSLHQQYFNLRIDLAKINQNTIDLLYSPSVVAKSWASVQVNMQSIEDDLRQWRSCVPAAFDFSMIGSVSKEYIRGARILGFHYHMSRIMVSRPCLSPLDSRMRNQSERSSEFNHRTAAHCVAAAEDIVDLLPDHLDPVELYQDGPWYDQVNIIMRACAVIMLELSFGASHVNGETRQLIRRTKKLTASLREMGKHNVAAIRAWGMCMEILGNLGPHLDIDMSDVETDAPLANPEEPSGRHHSMYPSLSGLSPQHMASSGDGDANSSHARDHHQQPRVSWAQTKQPKFQIPSLHTQSSDPAATFPETWTDETLFSFDPLLTDVFGNPQSTSWDPLVYAPISQWNQQSAAATSSQQQSTTTGALHHAEDENMWWEPSEWANHNLGQQ